MGIFSRKGSKPSINNDNASNHSTTSLKSPQLFRMSSNNNSPFSPPGTATMPKVQLPKAPDPALDPVAYLRSIYSVRERSKFVLQKAKRNQLNHFNVDMSKFSDTVNFVVSIVKRDFATEDRPPKLNYQAIPPHGRWEHFNVGGKERVEHLLASWPSTVDATERCRRLLDLFLVSVLLDAGAGTKWTYKSKENQRIYRRSEGLAVASLEMFKAGVFSSNPDQPHQVDASCLRRLSIDTIAKGLQISQTNPIDGLEGRASVLIRLGDALRNREIFGPDGRPGNMLDYLLCHPTTSASSVPVIVLPTLWSVLVDGLAPIWPASRTTLDGVSLGDAWPCNAMPSGPHAQPWENIVPFHKLTQWLCYSLMQVMTKQMKIQFAGAELMTGLPEYRNGGLFIDTGVLTLKKADQERGEAIYKTNAQRTGTREMEVVPMFTPDDDVIVEWRALTVGFLDMLLDDVNDRLREAFGDVRLTLPQLLEAGSWKGGREIAEVSRPNTKEPPIMILSDGTVF